MSLHNINVEDSNNKYCRFISGELIDLCVPNELAITEDGWAEWFNNIDNLSATQHGVFPNHRSTQYNILNSLAADRTKIVLLVCNKASNTAVGVISLQNINFQQRSAEITINIAANGEDFISPLVSLEAMALITQHGFEVAGLRRIYGGQAYPYLASWNKYLELIGYKSEGITRASFIKGQSVQDTLLIACHYDHYLKIKSFRGSLWGSAQVIRQLMKKQPKISFAQQLNKKSAELEEKYFEFLFVS